MEKGSLDFDRPEAHVVLDDQGLPLDVRKVIQLGSHRLIEEFMVLANETVAGVLSGARFPLIYRVHERPSSTDLLKLEEALARLGIRAGWRKEGITPRAFQGILEDARGRKEEALVIDLVLRSMKRAIYSVTNVGHFGLASERYTHFTSPIRRYPDLTVHRQVKAWIRSEQPPYLEGEEDRLKEIADLSTERERIADQAEWDSIDLKTVQYMESRIGEAFSGTISRLLAIGFFVLLDSPFIEGMVLLRDLVGDYYDFIEEEYVIRGRRTGRTFKIGDRVKVQVVRTDRRRREIDFRLLGHSRS
jgi:ribonuclease R